MHEEFTSRLAALSSAEDFLNFFAVPYEQSVVNVNRLHILKRFQQYLRRDRNLAGLSEAQMFTRYRHLLAQAYQDFVRSNAAQEKVFKVFQDVDGRQHVSLDSLRATLKSA